MRKIISGFCIALFSWMAVPAAAQTYDCKLRAPEALFRDGEKVELKALNLGGVEGKDWSFSVTATPAVDGKIGKAIVHWPSDPIQLAGSFPLLPTAKNSLVFMALSGGPCMFTEQACMSLVQIVEQADKPAKILVLPAALWSDKERDARDPFVAMIEGECMRKDP